MSSRVLQPGARTRLLRCAPGVPRASMAGLSLIELMVALALGLLVVLAAIGLFASNRAVYGNTESLARIQENARAGFEMMARDIREADGTVCRSPAFFGPIASPSGDPEAASGKMPLFSWWRTSEQPWGQLGYWGDGLRGSDDGIELRSAFRDALPLYEVGFGPTVITLYYKGQAKFRSGDELLACDGQAGYLFTAQGAPGGITHQVSAAIGPCPACASAKFQLKPEGRPAFVVPVTAVRWSLKPNGRGGRSLYREGPGGSGGDTLADEVVEDVRALKLSYLLPGAIQYVNAAAVGAQWKKVRAVRIELELEANKADTGDAIKRRIVHVVSLRNRNP